MAFQRDLGLRRPSPALPCQEPRVLPVSSQLDEEREKELLAPEAARSAVPVASGPYLLPLGGSLERTQPPWGHLPPGKPRSTSATVPDQCKYLVNEASS